MVIGRQVPTPWDKRIDLLCIDGEGKLIVLELKRDKTEREIVAQTLDYGSFVRTMQSDEVRRIFAKYQKDYFPGSPAKTIEEAFGEHFRGQPALVWHVIFPKHRRVWFDEDESLLHYTEKFEQVGQTE
jgi:hypothetical protein